MPCRHLLVAGAFAAGLGLGLAPALAQTYPSKPIKLIVPFTPGSPLDVLARLVSNNLSPRIGQSIILENRPGAGTTIGTKMVASADPDGYTLMIAASSFAISSVMYPNAGYDPLKSFDAVGFLARSPQVLVITPDVPAKTLKEFVAYAHANPGKLNFGFGLGTLPHVLGEYFKVLTKTDIASIPYKGGEPVRTDMLGGRIQMNFGPPPSVAAMIQQGKVRPLAVTTEARYRGLPDVPTFTESGLPQLSISFTAGTSWRPPARQSRSCKSSTTRSTTRCVRRGWSPPWTSSATCRSRGRSPSTRLSWRTR